MNESELWYANTQTMNLRFSDACQELAFFLE